MKILLLASLFQISFSAHATLCSAFYVSGLKKQVDINDVTDKWKHCSLSCLLARRCGTEDAFLLGIIKELADIVGPGNAEWSDLKADANGVTLYQLGLGKTDQMCKDQCKSIYPHPRDTVNSCRMPSQSLFPSVN